MENKKKLCVTCDVCDARKVQESTLAAYASVRIVGDCRRAGQQARELLSRYGVSVVADRTMDLDEEVRTHTVNGRMELKPGQVPAGAKMLLCVNGVLEIAPGCEEVLRQYLGITINGRVLCPESMVHLLSNATVNGCIDAYPDGCILLKSTAVLDRTFHLRSKQNACYHASGRVVALAPDIDFGKLAEKNVRFSTKRLLVVESLAEQAIPLFDERTDIEVLPDGCVFLNDDAELDENLLRRCGGKLYLNGDLTVGHAGAPLLEQFSYLQVNGDIMATRAAAARLGRIEAKYDNLRLIGGTRLCGRSTVTVDRALLEMAEDGVSLMGCALVRVGEDVPPELLRERMVSLMGCASVRCTDAQRAVLQPISEGVASFDGDKLKEENDESLSVITADYYTL